MRRVAETVKCATEDEVRNPGDYRGNAGCDSELFDERTSSSCSSSSSSSSSSSLVGEWAPAARKSEWQTPRTKTLRDYALNHMFNVSGAIAARDRFLHQAGRAINQGHPLFAEVEQLAMDPGILSMACLMIMHKFRETSPMQGFCSKTIRYAERTILTAVNWNVRCITGIDVVNAIIEAAPQLGPKVQAQMLREAEFAGRILLVIYDALSLFLRAGLPPQANPVPKLAREG
eukprot:CAMPEP_0173382030 /NCGR_PEP_ID=MMETSP1356-20130122/4493_1 /TAXON_ID=77927 ORGANISM="Hemiselmis virescens, Strain PCC157" /NCGR_SAMPLE_ID=MMETSP1356 /ASSEMBLY_ACC=CAM_ASM_000847 /LENGTH=230 /DNA_ID=CAMNT_0014336157 /DNA_START=304 /DNA_END=994 /DNA_ORIENTATION=+